MTFFSWLSFSVTYLSGTWLISSSVLSVIPPDSVLAVEVPSLLYVILKSCICMFLHLCVFLLQCYTASVMVAGSLLFSVMISQPDNYCVIFLKCRAQLGWAGWAAESDWGRPNPLHCRAWPRDGVALDQLGSNWAWKNAPPRKPKVALFVEKALLFLNPLKWGNLSQNTSKITWELTA